MNKLQPYLHKSRKNLQDKMNRDLLAVSNCMKAVLRAVDEEKLLTDVCHIICDKIGYRMAWVGYAENGDEKTVRPMAWAGFENGYLSNIRITWDDSEYGRGPTGSAIRNGATIYTQNFSMSPKTSIWRDRALDNGYRSSIALPLKDKYGGTFGALSIYSSAINSFTPEEISLLEELAVDLSFGIETLRTRIEYQQTLEALKKSEERYRAIFNNSQLGIFRTTLDGAFLEMNNTFAKMFGYDSPQHKINEVTDIANQLFVYPEDRSRMVADVMKNGVVAYPNILYKGKDNRNLMINLYMKSILDNDGSVLYLEGFAHDNTSIIRAEQDRISHMLFFERLDQVNKAIQGTNDLETMINEVLGILLNVFHCDRAGLLYPCDPDLEQFQITMECFKQEYSSAFPLKVNLPPDQELIDTIHKTISAEEPVAYGPNLDYPIQPNLSKNRNLQSQMVAALYPKDTKPYMISVQQCSYAREWTSEDKRLLQEISRRLADALTSLRAYQDLEHRVADRTAKLEKANKELESFAYTVSHDLRAPLRHIDGYIDMFKKHNAGNCDDQSIAYMETIAKSSERMGMLIDGLLSFSRIGRCEITRQAVDMRELAKDAISELYPQTQNRSIEWKFSMLPAVYADRTLLRAVMVNLISNALKFTSRRDNAIIEIAAQSNCSEHTISVSDNGVGFNMKYANKLFGVFQRLHRIDEFEGTGIGLANVRRIIERHGGRTWAEAMPDQGATVYFTLPVPPQETY